jgi:hypothetical protein
MSDEVFTDPPMTNLRAIGSMPLKYLFSLTYRFFVRSKKAVYKKQASASKSNFF